MAKIDDVAKRAGVSKGTVSNVFSQKRPTSKKVTEKVLQASRELNYVPNHIARSLVTKRTMAVGLTIPHGNFFFSAFHNQFINGVVLEGSRFGYRVLLDTIPIGEVQTPSLASYPIDGAIVLGPTVEDARIAMLDSNRIPFVTVGKIMNDGVSGAPTVNNDNKGIIRDICDYLIGLGHRNIAFMNASANTTVSIDRAEAFRATLEAHRIEPGPYMIHYKPPIHSNRYIKYGYDETVHLIRELKEDVTAIIADDDRTAFSVLYAIKDLGLRVPEDVSLFVICGDQSMMDQAAPALTGMDLRPSELGVQAVRLLMRELGVLADGSDEHRIVDSVVIERSSCSKPASRASRGDRDGHE